jgi:hypothetical protein
MHRIHARCHVRVRVFGARVETVILRALEGRDALCDLLHALGRRPQQVFDLKLASAPETRFIGLASAQNLERL